MLLANSCSRWMIWLEVKAVRSRADDDEEEVAPTDLGESDVSCSTFCSTLTCSIGFGGGDAGVHFFSSAKTCFPFRALSLVCLAFGEASPDRSISFDLRGVGF